jgi:hypothetical protein
MYMSTANHTDRLDPNKRPPTSKFRSSMHDFSMAMQMTSPIGSMYAIYGNIYHQYTPNVSIYTIHGSYGL